MLGLNKLLRVASPETALRRAKELSDHGNDDEAFALFAKAAEANLPEAEHRVALCYLGGLGVPASRSEGASWLERAATHGYVESQVMLAGLCAGGLTNLSRGKAQAVSSGLFEHDDGGGPDFDTALKWSRLAAEAGSPSGQAMLAYVLTHGPEAIRDLEAAHGWFERSALAGCPEGCLGYALSLARRARDEAGRRNVVAYLSQAAAAELPTAIYLLGGLTEHGVGVERNPALAVELFKRAAEKGLAAAQVR